VIQSFKHKGLKRFFEQGDPKGLPAQYINKIRAILAVLNRTTDVNKIRFYEEDVFDVNYEDYH